MKMNYFTFGNGPKTMVILPGLSLKPICPLADAVSAAYALFAEDFTVYLFDRREDVAEGCSLEDMAEDTVTKIRELGLHDLYLYGVSQGGMMAQIMTLKHPELIRKLALASTCSCIEDETVIQEWAEAARQKDLEELLKAFVCAVYGNAYYEQYRDAIFAAYGDTSEEELKNFAIYASAVHDFDLREELEQADLPVFVTGSEDDQVIPLDAMKETAELLKAESFFFKGYSHAVYDEAEELKQKVHGFFLK